MAYKLFNLIAIATLAILASNQGVTQVNAVSVDHHNFVRHNVAAHGLVAKRQATKTPNRRRCRAPTSSGLAASSAAAAAPTTPAEQNPDNEQNPAPAPQQSAPAPAPSPEPAPAPAPAPPPSTPANGGGKVGIAWANPNDNELANWMVGKVSAYVFRYLAPE